jgi:predicted Zn finger-like uncharacterized protein
MNMITCCPACSTLFRVADDQLRVANGRVRCGQCMEVFDARAHMLPTDLFVPPNLNWQEKQVGQSSQTLDSIGETANTGSQAAVDRSALADVGAIVSAAASEPRREPAAAASPGFVAPAFELAPPLVPEESAAVPALIGRSPTGTLAVKTVATAQIHGKGAVVARSLPISARDKLDRRYAKLLKTLARLRENAEKRSNGLDDVNAGRKGADLTAPGGEQRVKPDSHALPVDTPGGDIIPDILTGRAPARQRKPKRERQSKLHDKNQRRVGHDSSSSRGARPDEKGDQLLRPIADFPLSEINRGLPLPVAAPLQPEPQSETKSAQISVPAFIKQARRRAFWALPQIRAGLWGVAGVLALVLAAQIAVSQRDRLAAHYPGMTPLLLTLCRPMQCQIAPWRHLSAVAIDGSTFVRTGPQGFRFTATLRNGGAVPVATPALELALIDAQEQPLARRVLNPADWGAPPQLVGYGEFNGAATLTVQDAANPQIVSNYRLTAFYP